MSSVQCHFCSSSNPPGARFCRRCLAQLNLAPCPHCNGVNELSATVCHACEGELLQPSLEYASVGSEEPGPDPAPGGIDLGSPSATRSPYSGLFHGSSRELYVNAEDAAARPLLAGGVPARKSMVLLRPEPTPFRHTAAPFNRRWIAVGVGAAFLLAVGMFVDEPSRRVVHVTSPVPTASPDTAFSSAEWDAYLQRAVAVQPESVPAILSNQPAQNPAATSPEPTFALPLSEMRAAPEVDNPIVIRPVEPAASRATVQSSVSSATATTFIGSATCTAGVMALGLCSFEAGQAKPPPAKPATQIGSSTDVAQRPLYREVTRGCREAAAALGLCTQ
jgi:ribosomal protein L40E